MPARRSGRARVVARHARSCAGAGPGLTLHRCRPPAAHARRCGVGRRLDPHGRIGAVTAPGSCAALDPATLQRGTTGGRSGHHERTPGTPVGDARGTTSGRTAPWRSAAMAGSVHCPGWASPPTCPSERDPVIGQERPPRRATPVARTGRSRQECGLSRWLDAPRPPTRTHRSCHSAGGSFAATPAVTPGDKPRRAGWQTPARRPTRPGRRLGGWPPAPARSPATPW